MVVASFKQDYNIDLTPEWLKKTDMHTFKALLGGLTKDTALGNYLQNEALKKDKNYQKLIKGDNKKQFNLRTQDGINNLHNFAKMFGGKE